MLVGRHTVCILLLAAVFTGVFSFTAVAGPFDIADEADKNTPTILSGLLDVRYAHTSQMKSSLSGGTNKLRYGGRGFDNTGAGGHDSDLFALSQASLVMDAPMPMNTSVHAQLNMDADTDSGSGSVGIMEAYGKAERRWEAQAARLRAGAFIPPISWEHVNNAWSTEYTLTPSAIGSWIGEDVKVLGGEATWEFSGNNQKLRLTGAAFSGGDQTGAVLLKRGWAIHDYQSELNTSLNLPNGNTVQPFRELDGQAGYYGRVGFSLFNELLEGAGGYWDNNGDTTDKFTDPTGTLATWHTRFWDAGGKVQWRQLTFISQFIHGQSFSATTSSAVWESWYALASVRIQDWIVSGRYDRFLVTNNLEYGYALTGDVQWVLNPRNRVALEFIEVISDPNLSTGQKEKDQIAQLNYRFYFGG